MKYVFLSDTHGKHEELIVPEGDVVVHSGDFTKRGKFGECSSFLNWLCRLPHEHKIIVPGNHDFCCQDYYSMVKDEASQLGITLLVDSMVELGEQKIYGFPWTPYYGGWAFNATEEQMKLLVDKIPEETTLLISHGPPKGYRDRNEAGEHCGCLPLYEKSKRLVNLRTHVFGHIHECYGHSVANYTCPPAKEVTHTVNLYNASLVGAREHLWVHLDKKRNPIQLELG